jgi:hypothetical protein
MSYLKGEFAVVPTDTICGRSLSSLWAEQTFRLFIFFYHGYLEEEKSMIHSFTVTFGAKYLAGMVTSVLPYETFTGTSNRVPFSM